MNVWLKDNASTMWSWAAVLVGAVIVLAISHDTKFQQFGIGLVAAIIGLLVGMAVFELIWQIAARSLNSPDDGAAAATPPKSRSGRR